MALVCGFISIPLENIDFVELGSDSFGLSILGRFFYSIFMSSWIMELLV